MGTISQLWSQHHAAFAAAAVVALALVLWLVRAGSKKYGKKVAPKLADDLAKGDYEVAAERELKAGHLPAAYDLFVRAQQPLRAAQIAVRQGRLQDAAELFEKAGSRKRAADLYRQVGMQLKADELSAEDERAAREREAQKAALRKRLDEDPDVDDGTVDMTTAVDKSAPAKLDLGEVAPATPAGDLGPGLAPAPAPAPEPAPAPAPAPETPSLFGIQALVDEAAEKVASQVLGMAATQASIGAMRAFVETAAPVRLGDSRGAVPAAPAVLEPPAEPASAPGRPPDDLSLGEAKPLLDELSFGEAKPAVETLSFGEAGPSEPLLAFGDEPPPAPIVETGPEVVPRAARPTPRTPIPAVGPSIGAYRMVRPSQPDVFTPTPEPRSAASRATTPGPRLGTGSGTHPTVDRRTPTPSPRPSLSLGTKRAPGEPPPSRTPLGAVARVATPGPSRPSTPGPAERADPKGTALGLGPPRQGK